MMSQYSSRNATVLKVKPSELQPGDIIIGSPPPNLPSDLRLVHLPRGRSPERVVSSIRRPRPGYIRRTSSLDRGDFRNPHPRRGDLGSRRLRRRDQSEPRDPYESEGSIPPRSRRGTSERSRRRRRQSNREKDTSSSSSSSDLGDTDEDEKLKKKAKWKKWGAIGLAGIASIHAGHNAYEAYEKAQALRQDLAEGIITQKEARRKGNEGRLRTAASVGIAAMGLKSAYDEIKEYKEVKQEYVEACERCDDRHQQRVERAKAMKRGEYKGHHELRDLEHYLGE